MYRKITLIALLTSIFTVSYSQTNGPLYEYLFEIKGLHGKFNFSFGQAGSDRLKINFAYDSASENKKWQDSSFSYTFSEWEFCTKISSLSDLVKTSFRPGSNHAGDSANINENINSVLEKQCSAWYKAVRKAVDSISPKKDVEKKAQDPKIISVIPFYCDTQQFCIVKSGSNGLIEVYLNNADTLPSAKSDLDKLKKFVTETRVNTVDFDKWINTVFDKAGDECKKSIGLLSQKVQDKIDKQKEKEIEEKNSKLLNDQQKEVDSLAQLLVDFDRVAGILQLKDSVPIFAVYHKNQEDRNEWPQDKNRNEKKDNTNGQKQESQKGNGDQLKVKVANRIDYNSFIGYIKIEKASVQIDNNRIFDISFDGIVYAPDGKMIRKLNTISNYTFSLSFKGLNNREFSRIIQPRAYPDKELTEGFGFNYGDVINYSPYNNDFTPLVKSANYSLSPDSATKIYRRRYSDYLSFRTFLDPLGFLGTNPNGFAQLEGDAVIPVNLRNYRITTWLPDLHANFSYIYNNTINSEVRLASTLLLANDSFSVYNPNTQTYIRKTDSANYMYNLDVIRKAYYQLYIRGSLLAYEIKKQNSWLNLEFGFRVFGSKVATKNDTLTYHKIVPEMNVRWVLRPDNIFGADLNAGLAFLGNLHRANNSPTSVNNPSFLWASSWAIPHELNIYVQTGKESKGGLFFRYNGWFAFNKKLATNIDVRLIPSTVSIRKTAYFPQILFGYSTNLSTMIKRAGLER